ncbi:Mfa1 family fimbria major subunit [Parabacteroides timonensis]|uniref:Mfa1 family fimbria major subunit n=1 Tax=Parabacteroides timonensis TaxID=1871013 RepID=UPI00094EF536|nr:Mfa1 family fimbria major subunit [Parabacteroides timonensis]
MKRKSTLWALAFACVAVSCSDDLKDGPNGNNGNEADGENVYVTVNIATGSTNGAMTKADDPTGGEDGDGNLTGSEAENKVNDVNLYLFEGAAIDKIDSYGSSDIGTEKDASLFATGTNTVNSNDVMIYGCGFTNTVAGNTPDDEPHHTSNATVTVKVNESPGETTKTYHVIAVTNLGSAKTFTTLTQLRDFLQETAWKGKNEYGTANSFVMSTHQMKGVNGGSSVSISQDNTVEGNPATTTVYVERLAARVDLKLADGLAGDGITVDNSISIDGESDLNQTSDAAKDKIKLTGYQLINQLKGGTYMLKRVTEELTGTQNDPYKAVTEATKSNYLMNEIWTSSEFKFNYVLDPWTKNKTYNGSGTFPTAITPAGYYTGDATTAVTTKSSMSEIYANQYNIDLNETTPVKIASATAISTTDFTPVLYTMENTASAAQQKTGFTTGMLFEGVYTPHAWSEYVSNDTETGVKVSVYKENSSFYVVNDLYNSEATPSRYLCKDLKTIGVLAFANLEGETNGVDIIKLLFNDDVTSTTVTLEKLKEAVAGMNKNYKLGEAYHDYLDGVLNPEQNAPSDFGESTITAIKWSSFITAAGKEADKPLKDPANETDKVTASENIKSDYNISFYNEGKSYYRYWIRHANNDDANVMGTMEFSIVRNNVYQLHVSGVSALGDPLPFTPGESEPGTDVESENIYIKVELYVRDWVKRNQGSIIL